MNKFKRKNKQRASFFRFAKRAFSLILAMIIGFVFFAIADSNALYFLMQSSNKTGGNNFINRLLKSGYDETQELIELSTGLNLALISQLDESYIKELLTLYKDTEDGKMIDQDSHIKVETLLGMQLVETGIYPNSGCLVKSYLPYENGKVIWNEPYKGVNAKRMTLSEFNSNDWAKISGSKNALCSWVDCTSNWRKGITPWQYDSIGSNKSIDQVIDTVSKMNKTGKADWHYLPDILAQNDKWYNDARAALGLTNEKLTGYEDCAMASTNHNRGTEGVKQIYFGMAYNSRGTAKAYLENATGADLHKQIKIFGDMIDNYMKNANSKNTYYELMDAESPRHMAFVLAAHNDGWFISEKALEYTSGVTVRAWKKMYPEDNIRDLSDVRSRLRDKTTTLPKAIKMVTGKSISAEKCKEIYGTSSDYDDGPYSSQANHDWGNIFYVGKETSSIYTHKLSDGSDPPACIAFDSVSAGHAVATSMLGPALYACMLKLGGLEGVDPANPKTYMNTITKQVLNTGTGDYTYGVTENDLPEVLRDKGIDVSKLSKARLKLITEAARQALNSDYLWGHQDAFDGTNRGKMDCSGFVYRVQQLTGFMEGYGYMNTAVMISVPKPYRQITPDELLPGDIIVARVGDSGHTLMYLGQSQGTTWFAEAWKPNTPCGIYDHPKTVYTDSSCTATVNLPGNVTDKRVYKCLRNTILEAAESHEQKTYAAKQTPSTSINASTIKTDNLPNIQVCPTNFDTVDKSKFVVNMSSRDIQLMIGLLRYEAEGEGLEGQIAVAEVAVHRMQHPSATWGSTMESILNSSWNSGLNPDVAMAKYNTASQDVKNSCYTAAIAALNGSNLLGDPMTMYFRTLHYHTFGTPVIQVNRHYFSK